MEIFIGVLIVASFIAGLVTMFKISEYYNSRIREAQRAQMQRVQRTEYGAQAVRRIEK